MEHDNNNRGIIGVNSRKKEKWHPDRSGSATVDGVDYFVDGWIHDKKDGSGKVLSLRFRPKVEKEDSSQNQSNTPLLDDEAPF